MERYTQTLEEILSLLSPVDATWMDEHATAVVGAISSLPIREVYDRKDISRVLATDFDVGITLLRLVLGLSKDEFQIQMQESLSRQGGTGVTRFKREESAFLDALDSLGVCESLTGLVNRPVD